MKRYSKDFLLRAQRSEAERSKSRKSASCWCNGTKKNSCVSRKRSILGLWFIEEKMIVFTPEPISVNIRPDPTRHGPNAK